MPRFKVTVYFTHDARLALHNDEPICPEITSHTFVYNRADMTFEKALKLGVQSVESFVSINAKIETVMIDQLLDLNK